MILPQLTWRFLHHANWRCLWKFATQFGLGGLRAMRAFEKRLKNNVVFPPFLFLSITNKCNLRCQGCWVNIDAPDGEMTREDMQRVLDSCKANQSRFFGILGGEPLLHPWLWDVLEANSDCYFQVFTNGTVLRREDAQRMRALGNVTPLVSLEGDEAVSDVRRGGKDVFGRAVDGLRHCIDEGLVTGVATSLCQSNIDSLLSEDHLDRLIEMGVLYAWYYIYRPSGGQPCPELALTPEQVTRARRFMVEMRCRKPIVIVDSYWDHLGRALCPAAVGISHHISPWGDIEPCPPIQFAGESIRDGDVEALVRDSEFLAAFRTFSAEKTRGCVLLECPRSLAEFVTAHGGKETSRRCGDLANLAQAQPGTSHNQPGAEIPERHWAYRFAKKNWFFGFGAYG